MSVSLRSLAQHASGRGIASATALAVAGALVSVAVPWLIGDGVTRFVESAPTLYMTLATVLALLTLQLGLEVGATIAVGRERYRTVERLRKRWYARVLALPPGTAADERHQEWISILSYDIPRVAELVVDTPVAVARAGVTLVGAVVLMLAIHPLLAGAVLLTAPIAYLVARLAVGALGRRGQLYWDHEVNLMTRAEEAFRSLWVIRAFGQERRHLRDFELQTDKTRAAGVTHLNLLAVIGPTIQFVTFAGMVVIALVASAGVGGELSPGALLSFVLYGLLLSSPLRAFADAWSTWQETEATLGRFRALDELEPTPAGGARTLDSRPKSLAIQDLVFSWRDEPLLRGGSLTLEAGERVALIGPNGCGKTTLIALLLGFVRPQSGALRVDGVDLDELEAGARRRLFAVVPQHAALFGGTIRENVCFARPDATDADVESALSGAHALDFVSALPDGLDTRIGDHGLQLSGGQRQRVAIARALLTDSPILILDEATSGFDAESAVRFAAELDRLGDRTVIWITHDAAPLEVVDRVVNLVNGRFVERLAAKRAAM